MTQSERSALDILATADFDPIIAEKLFEDALGGYWEEAIEKIKDELDVGQREAELVYDHIRSVAVGRPIDFVEVAAEEVEFKTIEQRSGPGNPFVLWTSYFARAFVFNGETMKVEAFDQIWKTVPKA
ncbi:hypothetical protein OIU34_19940 [Pararhizobium sp. BT-229]|uniref:hypothetical protein n=1 Tax=Pararhizobium sp. BT-229 TaxID=2986923 RepID=UPI0021F75054|nr:hypothetical protein [Pararhizobium sp. BT-229]MCV9964158.1 hypothetical protein [Pararhizobium sp. BT-229]